MWPSLTDSSDAPPRRARAWRATAALVLAAALAGSGPAPASGAEPATAPAPAGEPGPATEEARLAAGAIVRYVPAERRLELETAAGPLTLRVDRDTVVFTARGVGTVRDLAPGVRVRAAWIGAPARAVWVELARPAPAERQPASGAPPALPPPPPRPGTTSAAPCDKLPCE